MFYEEGNALTVFIKPRGYKHCNLMRFSEWNLNVVQYIYKPIYTL